MTTLDEAMAAIVGRNHDWFLRKRAAEELKAKEQGESYVTPEMMAAGRDVFAGYVDGDPIEDMLEEVYRAMFLARPKTVTE